MPVPGIPHSNPFGPPTPPPTVPVYTVYDATGTIQGNTIGTGSTNGWALGNGISGVSLDLVNGTVTLGGARPARAT